MNVVSDLKDMANFVGLLLKKSLESHPIEPLFIDVKTSLHSPVKKCRCKLYSWTTEGTGYNKKQARQNAAELMLGRFENQSCYKSPSDNVAMKINLFCYIHGKEKPCLNLVKREANGLFVVRYVFEGCTSVGIGRNKETAKEIALEKIAHHFDMHTFYYHYLKNKENLQRSENPLVLLTEFCRARKEELLFHDVMSECYKSTTPRFVVACSVRNLVATSQPNFSKKNAKLEAASLMLDKLVRSTKFNILSPD